MSCTTQTLLVIKSKNQLKHVQVHDVFLASNLQKLIPSPKYFRTGQGTSFHPDQGRLPPRLLAETQQPQAPQEALSRLKLIIGEPGWPCRSIFGLPFFYHALISKNTQVEKSSEVSVSVKSPQKYKIQGHAPLASRGLWVDFISSNQCAVK